MHRSAIRKTLRGIAVAGGVAVMGVAGGTAASAASATPKPGGAETNAWSAPVAHPPSADGHGTGYRGTQGFNLCLLSRCSTGSGDDIGSGTGLVQGGNLCLLSYCEVRP